MTSTATSKDFVEACKAQGIEIAPYDASHWEVRDCLFGIPSPKNAPEPWFGTHLKEAYDAIRKLIQRFKKMGAAD